MRKGQSVTAFYVESLLLILVFIGCGTAMLTGCDAANGGGYVLTAFAFGLAVVAVAYGAGNISGGHVNPAVSLAVLIRGGITAKEFAGYAAAQCLGALAGSGLLYAVFALSGVEDMTGALGTNSLAGVNGSAAAGFIVEAVLTCIFVMTVLGATSEKQGHGPLGGLVIGLTLTGVHILGIGLTGTSVNPARSLGPAVIAAVTGNTAPAGQLAVFIIAPLAGAAAAAFIYQYAGGNRYAFHIQGY